MELTSEPKPQHPYQSWPLADLEPGILGEGGDAGWLAGQGTKASYRLLVVLIVEGQRGRGCMTHCLLERRPHPSCQGSPEQRPGEGNVGWLSSSRCR